MIGHELINKSELARKLGITPSALNSKILQRGYHKFSPEQEKKLNNIYIELFESLFDITTIEDFDRAVDMARAYLFD